MLVSAWTPHCTHTDRHSAPHRSASCWLLAVSCPQLLTEEVLGVFEALVEGLQAPLGVAQGPQPHPQLLVLLWGGGGAGFSLVTTTHAAVALLYYRHSFIY